VIVAASFIDSYGVIFTIVLVRQRSRLRRTAAAIRTAAPTPVGLPEPPPDVGRMIDELADLGFRSIGATDTVLPEQPPFRGWVLVEESGETWIEVGMTHRTFAVVLSTTPAGRQVETSWPRLSTRIDHPDLLLALGSPTLALTIADHRSRLAADPRAEAALRPPPADPAHPEGWRVRSFEDFLAVEAVLRERTGGMRIGEFIRSRVDPAVQLAAAMTLVGFACGLALVLVR
jgi:hypothetical protein